MTLSKEARAIRQKVYIMDKQLSSYIDATTTTDTKELAIVAEKLTVQADGDLIYTIHISVNGEHFPVAAAITTSAANEIGTYSTGLFTSVKITRISGSGTVTIIAK